jgi:hypothetical protein
MFLRDRDGDSGATLRYGSGSASTNEKSPKLVL